MQRLFFVDLDGVPRVALRFTRGCIVQPRLPDPLPPGSQRLIRVYNLRGQRVQARLDQPMTAGEHSIPFDAADLSSGVYIIQLKTPAGLQHQKILLIK